MKRALAITFDGVMLSNGVSASDALSSGLVPSMMVPRVSAAEPVSVSTPGRIAIGIAPDSSTPVTRTSPKLRACASGPDALLATTRSCAMKFWYWLKK